MATRALAKKIIRLAESLAIIGTLFFVAAVFSWRSEAIDRMAGVPENSISHNAAMCWHVTLGCIIIAVILFVIAQIVHIRANSEK